VWFVLVLDQHPRDLIDLIDLLVHVRRVLDGFLRDRNSSKRVT
jgi:hypothetical protein